MGIKLFIDSENQETASTAIAITTSNDSTFFTILGKQIGDFKLFAQGSNYESNIRSNLLTLHVFPTFRAQPSEILLAPGCISTVSLVGGPTAQSVHKSSVTLDYHLDNDNVVKLRSRSLEVYHLKGFILGEATITFKLMQRDQIIVKTQMKITVALIDGISIGGIQGR